jgi:prepilin-type N-terminal cleavage/methylation domain-containing protein
MRIVTRQRGLTLIELMVAITIGSLLLAFGAPALADYVTNARLRASGNVVLADMLFAQREAIKRNGRVGVVSAGSTISVLDRTTTPGAVLHTLQLPEGVVVDAVDFDFGSQGAPVPFPNAQQINLSMTNSAACSSTYRCPSVRIGVSGDFKVCGDKNSCQ